MKKNLLLMMLCCPMVLAAQGNGVTVSNLAVSVGSPTTVTFNVSWDRDAMPVALWSDTVWVFVDYNKNGVMERLPVTSATASAGTITKIPGNDKGVWIAGDARKNGSFSAKVELLTAVKNVAGACAYASNYPPVVDYVGPDWVTFTGTPPYDLVLDTGSGTVLVRAYNDYNVTSGHALKSFTDATGAPGTFACVPPATPQITHAGSGMVCQGTNVVFSITSPDAAVTYTWSGSSGTASGVGNCTFTANGSIAGVKSVTAYAQHASGCHSSNANPVTYLVMDDQLTCPPSSPSVKLGLSPGECAGAEWRWYSLIDSNGVTVLQAVKIFDSSCPPTGDTYTTTWGAKIDEAHCRTFCYGIQKGYNSVNGVQCICNH
jgi:hypothetical protein